MWDKEIDRVAHRLTDTPARPDFEHRVMTRIETGNDTADGRRVWRVAPAIAAAGFAVAALAIWLNVAERELPPAPALSAGRDVALAAASAPASTAAATTVAPAPAATRTASVQMRDVIQLEEPAALALPTLEVNALAPAPLSEPELPLDPLAIASLEMQPIETGIFDR